MIREKMYNPAADAYFRTSVLTASKGKLLLMLYDAAVRDSKKAAEAIQAGDIQTKNECIQRVMNILIELASTLNHKIDPKFSGDLLNHYLYLQNRLYEGTSRMDAQAVKEVAEKLDELRSAWKEIIEKHPVKPAADSNLKNA